MDIVQLIQPLDINMEENDEIIIDDTSVALEDDADDNIKVVYHIMDKYKNL